MEKVPIQQLQFWVHALEQLLLQQAPENLALHDSIRLVFGVICNRPRLAVCASRIYSSIGHRVIIEDHQNVQMSISIQLSTCLATPYTSEQAAETLGKGSNTHIQHR